MRYIIDRFEENFAVCETESGKYVNLDRNNLPKDAKEGDVLFQTFYGFVINTEETEKRKERIKKLADDLWV